ncbi:hypothetical protein PCASD_18940 [Puccinia coronata f. sp. avenae]|uniref:Uncharacterized protein n=1 Tax=Puccinia coronata f. sp. avenae TaxID=200324 RepID=A0A2N5T1Z8_9BASI|nr:hypothetical protein PCASD_18940 [Puccinia coronata f. sp. avenae]
MQEPSNAKLEVPGSTPGASATHSQTPSVDPPHRTPTSNNSSTGAATQESIRIMNQSVPSGHVDLQHFKTSNGPTFTGPFHLIEPFLNWIKAMEIFFMTKGIFHDTDRIAIVGNLIRETNTLAFYTSKTNSLGQMSWITFKELLFGFALPPLWQTTLKLKLQDLQMTDSESFSHFSTRGRTLMSMYNFNSRSPMTEWDLAEAMSIGLIPELKVLVDNFGKLLKEPFNYNQFEQRVALFYKGLAKKTPQRNQQVAPLSQPSAQPTKNPTSKEDVIWRIHAYLDSVGKCHYSKNTCGHAAGTCLGPLERMFIDIPPSFVTPPKPLDYKAPKARAPPLTTGQSAQAPAGRPANQAASVAAVAETDLFPKLDAASVLALAALDKELHLAEEERYITRQKPPRLIFKLHTNGGSLLGLIDTGAEINLISDDA